MCKDMVIVIEEDSEYKRELEKLNDRSNNMLRLLIQTYLPHNLKQGLTTQMISTTHNTNEKFKIKNAHTWSHGEGIP